MILRPVGLVGGDSSALLAKFRWNVDLVGTKNGVNKVFTTPETFVWDGFTILRSYMNGLRQREGATNDFTVSESGGVGTGYDTVTFSVAPNSDEKLTVDYLVP